MVADQRKADLPAVDYVLQRIVARLPAEWTLLHIGGGVMMRHGLGQATKDVDVVVAIPYDAEWRVPETPLLVAVAADLSSRVRVRRDQTCVKLWMETPHGSIPVELLRGRKGGGGYFISRRILERIVALSPEKRRVREPPPSALAFLKAWAADDKDKLVASGRDGRGYHRLRAMAFRQDVARLVDLEDIQAADILPDLLALCGKARRRAVAQILAQAGWPVDAEPRAVK